MPSDVAADAALLRRFQNEVAYRDRMQPSEDEVREDAEQLGSKDGLVVVAWLWPNAVYSSSFDPFDDVSAEDQGVWDHAVEDAPLASTTEALKKASRAVDRQRARRREVIASRFVRIIEAAAQKLGHDDVEHVKTHLMWSTPLTEGELNRLLRARTPFPFGVIAGLCSALQLEFDDGWVLIDPQRLARRVEHSVRASEIAQFLDHLTVDNLENVARRLPRPTAPEHLLSPDVYRAPAAGARYESLHEALAGDGRSHPDYTPAQIDQCLIAGGEAPLPDSARDRSWWAGSGAKTEGRPQVRAWWGAGYRVRNITVDPSSGEVVSVGFEALPGRVLWYADPGRTSRREYRALGPNKVRLYPDPEVLSGALTELVKRLTPFLESVAKSAVPEDPDVRSLTEFLDAVGEADRSEIERHFGEVRDENLDASWMTNLLTRARRQGWTVNKGTRKVPSWAATRKRAMLLDEIAENCNVEAPSIDPADPVPVEFLRRVANAIGTPSTSNSVQQIAREIVESRGASWKAEFESADESVTSLGLEAINDAIGPSMVWRPEWDAL